MTEHTEEARAAALLKVAEERDAERAMYAQQAEASGALVANAFSEIIAEIEARLTASEASASSLREERDRLRRELYLITNDRDNLRDAVGREVEISDEVRAALRPFETMASLLLWDGMPDGATGSVTVTLGDFRRARALIQEDTNAG